MFILDPDCFPSQILYRIPDPGIKKSIGSRIRVRNIACYPSHTFHSTQFSPCFSPGFLVSNSCIQIINHKNYGYSEGEGVQLLALPPKLRRLEGGHKRGKQRPSINIILIGRSLSIFHCLYLIH